MNINNNHYNDPIPPGFISVRGYKMENGPLIPDKESPFTYLVPLFSTNPFPMANSNFPPPTSIPTTGPVMTHTVSSMRANAPSYQPSSTLSKTNQIFNQLKTSFVHHLQDDLKQMQSELVKIKISQPKTEEKVETSVKSDKCEIKRFNEEEYVEFEEENDEDNFVTSNHSENKTQVIEEEVEHSKKTFEAKESIQTETHKLDFSEIPQMTINPQFRTFLKFESHQIRFGKDFSLMYRDNMKEEIGFEHAKMRLELFYKTCEFIENNLKFFSENKISMDIEHNQFRATCNYLPKEESLSIKGFQHAHISFFANLACMRRNVYKMFLKGGEIELNGQNVSIEQILNLTNKVPPKVNEIDTICEANIRYDGLNLLKQVSQGHLSAKEASYQFAEYYKATMKIIWAQLNQGTTEKKKPVPKLIKEKLDNAYPHIGFEFFLALGPQDKAYIEGMRKAIFNCLDSYAKEKK